MGHCAFSVGRHIYILGGETAEGAQREVYALDTGAESIGAPTLRLTPVQITTPGIAWRS